MQITNKSYLITILFKCSSGSLFPWTQYLTKTTCFANTYAALINAVLLTDSDFALFSLACTL